MQITAGFDRENWRSSPAAGVPLDVRLLSRWYSELTRLFAVKAAYLALLELQSNVTWRPPQSNASPMSGSTDRY